MHPQATTADCLDPGPDLALPHPEDTLASNTSNNVLNHASNDLAALNALIDRILNGDTQAFTHIVHRWQGPLVNMAWRYCRDRSRAEELAQEAFLRIWRGLPTWRRESAFSTWIFQVAANVYRSHLKTLPTLPLDISMAQGPEPVSPILLDRQLEGAARDEAVRRAVLALPAKYREPVILYYFHEMDLAAAAATMGMPQGTMKARLSRARQLLRQRFPQLEDQLDSHPETRAHHPIQNGASR